MGGTVAVHRPLTSLNSIIHWISSDDELRVNGYAVCQYQCSGTTVQIKWGNLLSTQRKINIKKELTTLSGQEIQEVNAVSSLMKLSSLRGQELKAV